MYRNIIKILNLILFLEVTIFSQGEDNIFINSIELTAGTMLKVGKVSDFRKMPLNINASGTFLLSKSSGIRIKGEFIFLGPSDKYTQSVIEGGDGGHQSLCAEFLVGSRLTRDNKNWFFVSIGPGIQREYENDKKIINGSLSYTYPAHQEFNFYSSFGINFFHRAKKFQYNLELHLISTLLYLIIPTHVELNSSFHIRVSSDINLVTAARILYPSYRYFQYKADFRGFYLNLLVGINFKI